MTTPPTEPPDLANLHRLLVGSWQLVEWTSVLDDGAPLSPFGFDAVGRLTYTEDGRVWAALMRRKRPEADATTLAATSPELRAEIAAGYVSYSGTWRLEHDEDGAATVVHAVDMSLFPNWVGHELRRSVELSGGDLILRTRAQATRTDRRVANTLRWSRLRR
ncbi:MAG: lipocalin-like domain-containing protein [Myxococcales bacterium]|nr:lipocalin-like domain-containing protein [Myxococcales bacterium]